MTASAEEKARALLDKFSREGGWYGDPMDDLVEPIAAAIEAARQDGMENPWATGHHKPGTIDYFHNYGDCGGNLIDGCKWRARGEEGE